MRKPRKKWPLGKRVAVFLLIFGALTVVVSMFIAVTSEESLTPEQMKGVLISGFGIMEAGAVLGTVCRRKAGKDISFAIGACIGILLVEILQIFI